MGLSIDHVVLAGSDLDELSDWFESLTGVMPSPGGRHDGWGTRNRLVSLGPDSYLELIAPDPTQPDPAGPRPLGVDDVGPGEHRITTFACRAPGIEAVIEAARGRGFDPGEAFPMSRALPGGGEITWRLTLPDLAYGDGLIPFLIDWGETPPPPTTLPPGCELVDLAAEHPDPAAVRPALDALGVELAVAVGVAPVLAMSLDAPNGPVVV